MKKIICILMISYCFYGCAEVRQTKIPQYTPPGNPSDQIGSVDIYKKMKYGGRNVTETLVVKVDENGNTILLAGESSSNEVSIYLSADARKELADKLLIVQKMGDSAYRNGSTSTTYAGGVVGNRGCLLPGRIDLNLDLLESGSSWICFLKISGYDVYTMTTPQMGTPQGNSYVNLLLPPGAVENLLLLLEKAHDFQGNNRSKARPPMVGLGGTFKGVM